MLLGWLCVAATRFGGEQVFKFGIYSRFRVCKLIVFTYQLVVIYFGKIHQQADRRNMSAILNIKYDILGVFARLSFSRGKDEFLLFRARHRSDQTVALSVSDLREARGGRSDTDTDMAII